MNQQAPVLNFFYMESIIGYVSLFLMTTKVIPSTIAQMGSIHSNPYISIILLPFLGMASSR